MEQATWQLQRPEIESLLDTPGRFDANQFYAFPKSRMARAGLAACFVLLLLVGFVTATLITLSSLEGITLRADEMHLDLRAVELKVDAVFVLSNPSAVHQVTAQSVNCDIFATDAADTDPVKRFLGTLRTAPGFNPSNGAIEYPTSLLEGSNAEVLADMVAGRMHSVRLTFQCTMATTISVWHILPVAYPMGGEFSFGSEQTAAGEHEDTTKSSKDERWKVATRNTWPQIHSVDSAGISSELKFTFFQGHSMHMLFGSLLNHIRLFSVWLPEMDYTLTMDMDATRRTNSFSAHTDLELKHLQLTASSTKIHSSDVTEVHGAIQMTLPVTATLACPIKDGCIMNLPSIISSLPSWSTVDRTMKQTSQLTHPARLNRMRGVLDAELDKNIHETVDVDLLGANVNLNISAILKEDNFVSMVIGTVFDYNVHFNVEASYALSWEDSQRPYLLDQLLASEADYSAAIIDYGIQIYSAEMELFVEDIIDEKWNFAPDYNTLVHVGETTLGDKKGYYAVSSVEGENMGGFVGKKDVDGESVGIIFVQQGHTDINLHASVQETPTVGDGYSVLVQGEIDGKPMHLKANFTDLDSSTLQFQCHADGSYDADNFMMHAMIVETSPDRYTVIGEAHEDIYDILKEASLTMTVQGTDEPEISIQASNNGKSSMASASWKEDATKSDVYFLNGNWDNDLVAAITIDISDGVEVSMSLQDTGKKPVQASASWKEDATKSDVYFLNGNWDNDLEAAITIDISDGVEVSMSLQDTGKKPMQASASWKEDATKSDVYFLNGNWDNDLEAAITIDISDGVELIMQLQDTRKKPLRMTFSVIEDSNLDTWHIRAWSDMENGVLFDMRLDTAGPVYGLTSSLVADRETLYEASFSIVDNNGDGNRFILSWQLEADGMDDIFLTADVQAQDGMDIDCRVYLDAEQKFSLQFVWRKEERRSWSWHTWHVYTANLTVDVDGGVNAGGYLEWEDGYEAVFKAQMDGTAYFGWDYKETPSRLHFQLNPDFSKVGMEGLGIRSSLVLQDESLSVFYEDFLLRWHEIHGGTTVNVNTTLFMGEQKEILDFQEEFYLANLEMDPIDAYLKVMMKGNLLELDMFNLDIAAVENPGQDKLSLNLLIDLRTEEDESEPYAMKFITNMAMSTENRQQNSEMTMLMWRGDQTPFAKRVDDSEMADFGMSTKWNADRNTNEGMAGGAPKDFAATTKITFDSQSSVIDTAFALDGDNFDMLAIMLDDGECTMRMSTCGKMKMGDDVLINMNTALEMEKSSMDMTMKLKEEKGIRKRAVFTEVNMTWDADDTLMGMDSPSGIVGADYFFMEMAMPSTLVTDLDLEFDSVYMTMETSDSRESSDTTLEDFYSIVGPGFASNSGMPQFQPSECSASLQADTCTAQLTAHIVVMETYFSDLQLDNAVAVERFQSNFKSSVARNLGISEENVMILAFTLGSVRVEFKIVFRQEDDKKEFDKNAVSANAATSLFGDGQFLRDYGTPEVLVLNVQPRPSGPVGTQPSASQPPLPRPPPPRPPPSPSPPLVPSCNCTSSA